MFVYDLHLEHPQPHGSFCWYGSQCLSGDAGMIIDHGSDQGHARPILHIVLLLDKHTDYVHFALPLPTLVVVCCAEERRPACARTSVGRVALLTQQVVDSIRRRDEMRSCHLSYTVLLRLRMLPGALAWTRRSSLGGMHWRQTVVDWTKGLRQIGSDLRQAATTSKRRLGVQEPGSGAADVHYRDQRISETARIPQLQG